MCGTPCDCFWPDLLHCVWECDIYEGLLGIYSIFPTVGLQILNFDKNGISQILLILGHICVFAPLQLKNGTLQITFAYFGHQTVLDSMCKVGFQDLLGYFFKNIRCQRPPGEQKYTKKFWSKFFFYFVKILIWAKKHRKMGEKKFDEVKKKFQL